MDIQLNHYYSGTSGLLLPVPNKQFYPEEFKEKSRLCYYASLMNSIEINSSFYKIPQAQTIKKWAADVPEKFCFTFKLFKGITHNRDLAFNSHDVAHFMQAISQAGNKKGCLLVQFPPGVRIGQINQLKRLMEVLRANDPDLEWKIALEFRHPSLYTEPIYELLENFKFGMVFHDKGIASSPIQESQANFVYLRFHGPDGNYKGSYTDDILYEYATYIAGWLVERKQVFAYFNNTMGNAYGNLKTLLQMVENGV
ncbi:DUF72 domain-containing protein [Pedobacter nototheniae]|uniref:DUF72 domain-containing protein n=1 Tax=Pedobacter nototheniae TaxID=2488994 RepID=UPI00292D118D|nr:DUF72 domain-containing protein [Pedobacter nototheniae]